MKEMKIQYLPITKIKPYAKNPRMNDNAVEACAKSIKEYGFKVPIIVDKKGVIIAGHTRLKAAQKLGIETVPAVIADDLSEERRKHLESLITKCLIFQFGIIVYYWKNLKA